jgi:hypothetical protein
VSGGLVFEYHRKYMNNCSSIHNYSIEKENRQMTILIIL